MTLKSSLMIGAGVLALSTGVAAAAPAVVQNDLNLRAGPGTEYEVVAAMPAGTTVDVMGCQASWCQVAFNATTGFASRAFLGLGGPVASGPAYRTYGETYAFGGSAPAYGYDEGTYAYGSYGPGYGYYGGPTYGRSYGYYEGGRTFGNERTFSNERRFSNERTFNNDRTFGNERRFSEDVGVRSERRVGAATSVRGEASVRGEGSVRAERRGERAGVSGNARAETQSAAEIKGNNPMKAEKNSAAVSNARAPAEIQGNNPMKVGGGAAASEQRGTAAAGNARGSAQVRGNARATTGSAPRQGGY